MKKIFPVILLTLAFQSAEAQLMVQYRSPSVSITTTHIQPRLRYEYKYPRYNAQPRDDRYYQETTPRYPRYNQPKPRPKRLNPNYQGDRYDGCEPHKKYC